MDPLKIPSFVEGHLYKLVWALSIILFLAALVLGFILWDRGMWGEVGEQAEAEWTSEQKKEALNQLNERAQAEGVVPLSTEEKMEIMNRLEVAM